MQSDPTKVVRKERKGLSAEEVHLPLYPYQDTFMPLAARAGAGAHPRTGTKP